MAVANAGCVDQHLHHFANGVSHFLMEGDIRAPEVWVRVDSHGRRAAPIGVPDPLPRR